MRTVRLLPPLFLILLLTGCSSEGAERPMNFGIVQASSPFGGGMYRGGQPSAAQVMALRRDLNVRTIIKLNRSSSGGEQAAAAIAGIRLIEIPLDAKKAGSGDTETEAAMERAFAAFIDPANAPVYLHCEHGRDRTGLIIGLYRARVNGWPLSRIDVELRAHGHGSIMRRYLPHITRRLAMEAARDDIAAD